MKTTKLNKFALILFIIIATLWLGFSYMAKKQEQNNLFSVSEIRNDDTTYIYVKEKCDKGFLSQQAKTVLILKKQEITNLYLL